MEDRNEKFLDYECNFSVSPHFRIYDVSRGFFESDHESLGNEQDDVVAPERPSKPTIEET